MRLILLMTLVLCGLSSAYANDYEDVVPNEVIVKFKDNRRGQFAVMGKLAASHQLQNQKSWSGLNLHQFKTKEGARLEEVISELQADPSVEFAEPNYWVKATKASNPMTSADIRVPESWALLAPPVYEDDIPLVAVIDSGLDLQHPIYNRTNRVYTNSREIPNNNRDDDGNGYIDDVNGWNFVSNSPNMFDDTGHGTHVSGIVLGSTEDIFDFDVNAAPRIKILPLKFLNKDGYGKTSDAIDAVHYAIGRGVKVINNSWGGANYSATLHSALTAAYQKGIIIVSAAGNNSSNNDVKAVYPAALDVPSLVSVAASSFSNEKAAFSNYGPTTTHVLAPGVSILSTVPGGGYGITSGTSMAAPFVSGLAALIASVSPHLTGYQIKEIIMDTGEYRGTNLSFVMTGQRIHFENAVEAAFDAQSILSYQPEYSPSYSSGVRGMASTSNTESGFGCGRVSAFYDHENKNFFKGGHKPVGLSLSSGLWFLMVPLFMLFTYKRKYLHLNKRRDKRRRVNIKSQIVLANGWVLPVMIKDVSSSGAGLQVLGDYKDYNLDSATSVVLNMVFDTKGKQRYNAQIMRRSESGFIGIKFNK